MKYLDLNYWRTLARKHGVRLPRSDTKGFRTRRLMSRYGVSHAEFREVYGCSPTKWRRLNPDWDLAGFAGLLLEIVENRPENAGLTACESMRTPDGQVITTR